MSYCPHCGKEIKDLPVPASVTQEKDPNVSPKSRLLAMLLGIFCGVVGVHNFYLGKKKQGMAQAIVFGACISLIFIFYFIFIIIAATMGESFDAEPFGSTAGSFGFISFFCALIFVLLLYMGGIYYCFISALVQWIKIARGKAVDGNGLPVKNWNC